MYVKVEIWNGGLGLMSDTVDMGMVGGALMLEEVDMGNSGWRLMQRIVGGD